MTERLLSNHDSSGEEIELSQQLMFATTETDYPTSVRKKNTKTVRVPKIQSMLSFMMKHYKSIIIEELRQRLLHNKVDPKLVGHGQLYLAKKYFKCVIPKVNFWRVTQMCVLADVYLTVDLHTVIDNEHRVFTRTFCMEMYFDMSEDYEHWFEDCHLEENVPRRDMWVLSNYLIPVIDKQQIEDGAVDLLRRYAPSNWTDKGNYKAERLAEKLGLSVVYHPLYDQDRTLSILFFCESNVMVQEKPKEDEEPEAPHKEHVNALTIVINSNAVHKDYSQLEIYHECIHYYWHYLFYRLQDMHNNDICKLKAHRRVVEDGKTVETPLKWMEWQARRGSFGLMMPKREMLVEIQKRMEILSNTKYHMGEKMEHVAWGIAYDFSLPKFRVRARLIQLGNIRAKGALNYVDGKYIKAFDFSPKECEGDYTFVIDRKNLFKLFKKNEQVRELIESGKYVYVDGHLCLNSSKFVQESEEGPILTPWANAHVDKCCLRFICEYVQVGYTDYVFGCLRSDDEFNGPQIAFVETNQSSYAEQLDQTFTIAKNMPGTFHEALTYLMSQTGTTEEKLESETGISVRSISRLRSEERESYSIDQVIALCIGLHIPMWVAQDFLELAGVKLRKTKRQMLYRYILSVMYQKSLEEIQIFMKTAGEEAIKP